MNDIERADKITGWRYDWDIGDVPQRRHYEGWLRKQPPLDVKPHLPADVGLFWLETQPLDAIAALICAIDDARKPKGDGLPPGPWRLEFVIGEFRFVIRDANHAVILGGPTPFQNPGDQMIGDYVVRCGSQPVRDILAACDDAELARWAKLICKWKLPDFNIENVTPFARATVTFHPR